MNSTLWWEIQEWDPIGSHWSCTSGFPCSNPGNAENNIKLVESKIFRPCALEFRGEQFNTNLIVPKSKRKEHTTILTLTALTSFFGVYLIVGQVGLTIYRIS